MSDRLAFLRAIRASPDDDTARLAFADWLDERDDPLGEFVRVQLELEPIRYRIDVPRARALHRREDELLRRHGDDWIGTNELLTCASDFGPVFRRGLPDYACLSLDTFLKNGEALFAAHPTLRGVALYDVVDRCSELTLSPLLAKLDALEIADWPTEDDAISLSVSPHLDKIGGLKLWLGGEPWLLNELVRRADTRWPREIELVQLYGGAVRHQTETVRELNDEADRVAREANERLGRPVVRVSRPFERLFPLNGEVGQNICAGRTPDGRPALATGSFAGFGRVVFTEDGHVEEVSVRSGPVPKPGGGSGSTAAELDLGTAFVDWADDELRLEPGPIWVREFSAAEIKVQLWSPHLRDWTAPGGRFRAGAARGWLEHRNFVVNKGGNHWADWRGSIHSS